MSIFVKRVFTFLSMFLSFFYCIHSQEISYSDPYSEKMLLNPAYSGLNDCSEINLNYNKNFIYNFYSVSYNQLIKNSNTGIGIIISNNQQAEGAINNFKADAIYNYRLKLSHKKIINTAFQISYLQQNINNENLIFNDQINPINSIISQNSGETIFSQYKTYDFSVGTSYISDKYRTGITIHHIDKIFYKNELFIINPSLKIHIGKVFSIKNEVIKTHINSITPEIIYDYQNNFHQISYGVHIVNNIFLTRFFIKQNIGFNSFSSILTLGLKLKNIRLSYTYNIMLTKYIGAPISSNQLSMRYKFNCRKKRNRINTIYCSNI